MSPDHALIAATVCGVALIALVAYAAGYLDGERAALRAPRARPYVRCEGTRNASGEPLTVVCGPFMSRRAARRYAARWRATYEGTAAVVDLDPTGPLAADATTPEPVMGDLTPTTSTEGPR